MWRSRMRTEYRNVLALSAAVIAIGVPWGMAYAQAGPTFEVSPTFAGEREGVSRTPQKIAFQATLVPDIMAFAYELPLDRIERRPQWMYDNRYDVAVTTAAPTSLLEQKRMLQTLLEERFGLVAHRNSYPSPVYFLVRGSNVNLTTTKEADAVDVPEIRCNIEPFQPVNSAPRTRRVCVFGHASMSDLAAWLYSRLGLPVLDKTGITGLFDIEVPAGGRGGMEEIIPAVQKTLGLNLERYQGTAESLIID